MTEPNKPSGITLEMLRGAYSMRAEAYAQFFDVLREEFGAERAVELMSRATRRMGQGMGRKFAGYGPRDLDGLRDAFLGGIPCAADMFAPEIQRSDEERLEIQFHRCPLKDYWVAAGRSDEDLEHLCKVAGAIDDGLFTEAGFTFKGETWKPGRSGCCLLRVEQGRNVEGSV
jgi:hypothetical protein